MQKRQQLLVLRKMPDRSYETLKHEDHFPWIVLPAVMFFIIKVSLMQNAKCENKIRNHHLKSLCYKEVQILSKSPCEKNMKDADF